MNHWKKIFLIAGLMLSIGGCLGVNQNASSDEMISETASEDVAPEGSSGGGDDFAAFENAPADASSTVAQATPTDSSEMVMNDQPTAATTAEPQAQSAVPAENDEFAEFEQASPPTSEPTAPVETAQTPPTTTQPQTPVLEDEFDFESADNNSNAAQSSQPGMEFSESDQAALNTPPPVEPDPFIAPEPPVAPMQTETSKVSSNNVKIKSIQYKANDAGGAILIHADGPVNFTTRNNPDTQQLIVEIPGAQLPDKLKRPFNMRDIKGSFGSLDSYQEKGSNVARFVVQLRPNTSDPFVTAEGDTLLIVADKSQVPMLTNSSVAASLKNAQNEEEIDAEGTGTGRILTSRTLQEFLAGNSKFYGKKISIETNTMGVREALRFIAEEGGVNMVIADNVSGNVSLKLRDIPWDQAFVVIMKTRGLGYVRQGNLLRVATLADLRGEEEAAIKLTTDRLAVEPLVVRVFSVNYAKVDEMATKIKDFLTTRGKVIGDQRTNAVVVTDIEQNLDRVDQLIKSLDTQPPQVLIEGRIIEATDSFARQVGINWGFSGADYVVGRNGQGDVKLRPTLMIDNGSGGSNQLGISMGTLDIFGQLNATLSLAETENKIRILSSPRIVTLSNEKAVINQTVKQPYATTTVVSGVVTQSVTFQNMELILDVTPQITSDASVIMNIKVKRDLPGETVGTLGNAIESREATTKVMVKNGQTSVIGGVYQNDTTDAVKGVPYLKDIPVLGSLFRFKSTTNRRTELMIFLTPRIVAAGSHSLDKNDTMVR